MWQLLKKLVKITSCKISWIRFCQISLNVAQSTQKMAYAHIIWMCLLKVNINKHTTDKVTPSRMTIRLCHNEQNSTEIKFLSVYDIILSILSLTNQNQWMPPIKDNPCQWKKKPLSSSTSSGTYYTAFSPVTPCQQAHVAHLSPFFLIQHHSTRGHQGLLVQGHMDITDMDISELFLIPGLTIICPWELLFG